MIMPPVAHGVKVISIGMFSPGNAPVVWRGPMLHRALQQFLGRRLLGRPGRAAAGPAARHRRHRDLGGPAGADRRDPRRHHAAAGGRRGGRAGRHRSRCRPTSRSSASSRTCPACPARTATSAVDVFGTGGGQAVADGLTRTIGAPVPLLGQVPLDVRLREGGDAGRPLVLDRPGRPGRRARCARSPTRLGHRARGLAGRSLGPEPRRPLSRSRPVSGLERPRAR